MEMGKLTNKNMIQKRIIQNIKLEKWKHPKLTKTKLQPKQIINFNQAINWFFSILFHGFSNKIISMSQIILKKGI